MKKKEFNALGLMSGTSMDGVDLSLIKSDGITDFTSILNNFYEFDNDLRSRLINLRDQLNSKIDIENYSYDLKKIEREITLFYAELMNDFIKNQNYDIDLVGLHGQTIFHDAEKKISLQLGDGKLLSQISKKIVINNFRQNDLDNFGQGAPLVPIFHRLISNILNKKFKIGYPLNIINIGGITNVTKIFNENHSSYENFKAHDIGPGNCLIDEWIRRNSKKKFDENGEIAKSGKINEIIFNQAIDNFEFKNYKKSLDISNFDLNFVKGLSLEEGAATLTKFTAFLIARGLDHFIKLINNEPSHFLVCGGGRKNSFLMSNIENELSNKNIKLENIDDYTLNGDFLESQAFGYLAIRSYLRLPISFPNTTNCKYPTIGGDINRNF